MKITPLITLATLGTLFFASLDVAYAQAGDIFSLEGTALSLLSRLGAMLVALAIMLFFWGLVKFIANSSDAKEHEEGKKFIFWGLISLFVIFSLWAIVGVVLGDFGITPGGEIPYIRDN